MKTGDHVALRTIPDVRGTVIALQDGKAKVYWSSHTSQWINVEALMRTKRVERN